MPFCGIRTLFGRIGQTLGKVCICGLFYGVSGNPVNSHRAADIANTCRKTAEFRARTADIASSCHRASPANSPWSSDVIGTSACRRFPAIGTRMSRRPCARLAGKGGGALRSAAPGDHRWSGWPPPSLLLSARWPFPLSAETAILPSAPPLPPREFRLGPFVREHQPAYANGEQGYPHAYIDESQQQGQELHRQRQSNHMATSIPRKKTGDGHVTRCHIRRYQPDLTGMYNGFLPKSKRITTKS